MGFVLFVIVAIAFGFISWCVMGELRKNGQRIEQQNYMLAQLLGVRPMPQPEPEQIPQQWQTVGPNPVAIPAVQHPPTPEQNAAYFARRS